jgi:simple sugar transport system ATP-binding protein
MGQVTTEVPLLEIKDLHKHFGGVRALDGASLTIALGECVALVGDNGAGKSTLVKAISGVQPPDSGTLLINGEPVRINSADAAGKLGIETAYQDLALANSIDVVGNLFLGEELKKINLGYLSILDFKAMEVKAKEILGQLRIKIPDLHVPVGALSGGQRQAVAIGRAIKRTNTKLLILDEPTAALGVEEVRKVLHLIQTLREEKQTMLIISHDLEHVLHVSDRIIGMRSGKVVGSMETAKSTKNDIVRLIVGDIEE